MAPSVASCAVLFALSVACVSASRAINPNPEEYISITGGTANLGSSELSFGNVLPEVQTPWGFNGWAPTTALNSGSWWFDARASNLYGVRCTHQPSPWIGDCAWGGGRRGGGGGRYELRRNEGPGTGWDCGGVIE